jgi:hypothetical protein
LWLLLSLLLLLLLLLLLELKLGRKCILKQTGIAGQGGSG